MDLPGLGRLLVGLGLVLAAVGAVLLLVGRVPGLDRLGRLPGDIVIERGSTTVAIPLVTSLILSLVLTVVLNLLFRR
ncbi:MAG: DUF2905 domain-containing protein [Chloroflexia bacterium]|nr:DUF2905 domain-containing protein [Chloroflexia bacterium]